MAVLLALHLAASASVVQDCDGEVYTVFTDFRAESIVSDSWELPGGAVGWFGSSPVYEEESDHTVYLPSL